MQPTPLLAWSLQFSVAMKYKSHHGLAGLVVAFAMTGCALESSDDYDEDIGTAEQFVTHGVSGNLIRVGTGFCLQNNGSTVTQETCNAASPAQRWLFNSLTNGQKQIISASDLSCLDVPSESFAQGTDLQTYPCHGNRNQRFSLIPLGGGEYRIRPGYNSYCLDIEWGNAAGQRLQQFPCWSSQPNQAFEVRLRPELRGWAWGSCPADRYVHVVDDAGGGLGAPQVFVGDIKGFSLVPPHDGRVEYQCVRPGTPQNFGKVQHVDCPSGTNSVDIERSFGPGLFRVRCLQR